MGAKVLQFSEMEKLATLFFCRVRNTTDTTERHVMHTDFASYL